jgi:hypothetical protein
MDAVDVFAIFKNRLNFFLLFHRLQFNFHIFICKEGILKKTSNLACLLLEYIQAGFIINLKLRF